MLNNKTHAVDSAAIHVY